MFASRITPATRFSSVLVALVASLLPSSAAWASFDATTTYNVNNMQVVSFTYDGKFELVYAGAFQTTLSSNGQAVSTPLATYCVDVAEELASKESMNLTSISTLAGGYGAYVGSLYANFAARATTSVQQAALQLAIWETEYDGPSATSTAGVFSVVSAPQAVINQAICYYENNKLVANDISYLQAASGQSLVGPSLSGGSYLPPAVAAVPEPASVVMLGMGIIAAVGTRARRRARCSIAG